MAAKSGAFVGSAPIFAALGDETRLGLLARLCAGGPQSIARLTAGSTVTRQAVTKQLLVLAGAGLVRGVRRGRESRWALEPDQLEAARRYLDLISERWSERLAALERHLDSMPESGPRRPGRSGAIPPRRGAGSRPSPHRPGRRSRAPAPRA